MSSMLNMLTETLITLSDSKIPLLTDWLQKRIGFVNEFFYKLLKEEEHRDPDVIRKCYEIQESLLLYDETVFLNAAGAEEFFNMGLYFLRHVNEQRMQRKIATFLLLCIKINSILESKKEAILETIISTIPIVYIQSGPTFAKILIKSLNSINPQLHRQLLT